MSDFTNRPDEWIKAIDAKYKEEGVTLDQVYNDAQGYKTVYSLLNDHILNPKKNGFMVADVGDISNLPKDVELWTEAPCLMVPASADDSDWA
jgi:hypothetical protein